jgi:hypothetical protein
MKKEDVLKQKEGGQLRQFPHFCPFHLTNAERKVEATIY